MLFLCAGFVGVAAAMCGAKEVVISDLPEFHELMQKNVDANIAVADKDKIKVVAFDWYFKIGPPSPFSFPSGSEPKLILIQGTTICRWKG